jgi:hypothetical protein
MDPPFGDDGPGRGGDEMPASRREAQSYGTPRTAVALPRDRELDAHRRAPVDFISWNTDRLRLFRHALKRAVSCACCVASCASARNVISSASALDAAKQ